MERISKNLLLILCLIFTLTTNVYSEETKSINRVITLDEVISIGLKNSYSVKILNEKINQSLALQRKALALLLPILSAQGSYTRYDKEVEMSFPDINSLHIQSTAPFIYFDKYNKYIIQKENSFGAYLNLTMPLFNLPNYLTYKNSRDSIGLAELNLENQRGELIYNISVAYLNAISIKKSIAITRNSVELASKHLKVVETRYNSGDANELTLTKARLDLERTQNDLQKAEKAYKIAIESLALLLGTDTDIDVTDSVNIEQKEVYNSQNLFETAQKNRTDVKILRLNEKILNSDINIKKEKFLPSLNMNAKYRY